MLTLIYFACRFGAAKGDDVAIVAAGHHGRQARVAEITDDLSQAKDVSSDPGKAMDDGEELSAPNALDIRRMATLSRKRSIQSVQSLMV